MAHLHDRININTDKILDKWVETFAFGLFRRLMVETTMNASSVDFSNKHLQEWKKSIDNLIKYALQKFHEEERKKHVRKYRNLLNLAWSTNPISLVVEPSLEVLPTMLDPIMKSDEDFFLKLKKADFQELAQDFEDGDEHLSMLPLIQEVWIGLEKRPKVKQNIRLHLKSIVARAVLLSQDDALLNQINKYFAKGKKLHF